MKYIKHYIKTLFENQFMLALLVLGIALSFISIKALYNYYFVDYSIEVMATVVESYETITTNSGGRTNRSYHIKYTYNYKGTTYESDRYRHSHDTPSDVLQLKPGDNIKAFINRDNPNNAVIINEITWTNIVGSILGVFLVFASLIMHAKLSPYVKQEGI